MDAQHLWNLVRHDNKPDPSLEADQHWLGDEVGNEAAFDFSTREASIPYPISGIPEVSGSRARSFQVCLEPLFFNLSTN